ncbi:MAG: HPF/RaiA family ribosome-associated protein, partial [Hydrogenoanaerobacterium sp.]
QGMVYRSEKTADDRIDALDAVVDNLFRQIVKNKQRLGKRVKGEAFTASETDFLEQDIGDYQVVKTKAFPMKPMEIDEAILQMNMLGHEFYMFRNAEDNEINVVYKRNSGDYGVIEPKAE